MKTLFSMIAMMLMAVSLYAQDGPGTTFTISSGVSLPVYVKINGGGTLKISQRSYTTSTSVPNASSITDAYGNRCIYRQSHHYRSGVGTHYYYEITGVYSSSSSDRYGSYSSDDYKGVSDAVSDMGYNVGNAAAAMLIGISDTEWGEDCHRIDVGTGYGIGYGDLGVKVGWRAPVAFGMAVGIGYDPAEKHISDKSRMRWYAELQMWPTNGLSLAVGVGSRWYKKPQDKQIGISAMLNYEHQICGFIGATAGIGGSLSAKSIDSNGIGRFEFNVGLVFRVFES